MLHKHEIARKILYALRRDNSSPKPFFEVVRAVVGGDPNAARNETPIIDQVVRELKRAQLIGEDEGTHRLCLTKHFEDLRGLLNLSTQELANRSGDSVVCDPVFGKPTSEEFDVFVVLPFEERFFGVLDDVIRPACEARSLSVGFGKDLYASKNIMREVWSLIFNSRVVIADCTTLNPNVFYEIGIAHTLGRYVILLTQDLRKLPYDLQHLKAIEYSGDRQGLEALQATLVQWLEVAQRNGWRP
jgi:hypothetical protein